MLIIFGVITAIVGRAAFLPFPGVDNPAVCYNVPDVCTITDNNDPSQCDQAFSYIARGFGEADPECVLPNNTNSLMHNKNGRFVRICISMY